MADLLTGSCPARYACKGGVKGHNPHRMKLPFREALPVRAGSFTENPERSGRDFLSGIRRNTVRWHLVLLCPLLFLSLFFSSPGIAWQGHHLITGLTLESTSTGWLDNLPEIGISPDLYPDSTLSPAFELLYLDSHPEADQPNPEEFLSGDRKPIPRDASRVLVPGGQSSARQILIHYSDEPDWGMDNDLRLHFSQRLMGGSKGFRHAYYPRWKWHLPLPFAPQGGALERALHFYNLAKVAFSQKDPYWGFRFLARSLHYVQDIGQPFHTRQTSSDLISWLHPIQGTAQVTSNLHHAFEDYVAYRLQSEKEGGFSYDYMLAIQRAPILPADSLPELVKATSRSSYGLSKSLFRSSWKLFGRRFLRQHPVYLSKEDLPLLASSPAKAEFDRTAKESLAITASATKAFLELAYRDLLPYRQNQED